MADVKKYDGNSVINPKDKVECGSTVSIQPMPPTLQGLPDEEISSLEKLLVRKLDLRLMPMLVLIYIMNYLDRYDYRILKDGCELMGVYRNAIAAAKLSGITDELGLSSVQFQVF